MGSDSYRILYRNDSDKLDGIEYVVPAYYGYKTELCLRVSIWDEKDRLYEQWTTWIWS